jgi:hypothetical protein
MIKFYDLKVGKQYVFEPTKVKSDLARLFCFFILEEPNEGHCLSLEYMKNIFTDEEKLIKQYLYVADWNKEGRIFSKVELYNGDKFLKDIVRVIFSENYKYDTTPI